MSYNPNDFTQFIVKGINAKNTGATIIGTTRSANGLFFPIFAIFHVATANTIITPATISLGTNSATYNNILAASAMTGLTAQDTMLQFPLGTAAIAPIAVSTGIYANITSGATATAMTMDITIFGFYK